MGYFWVEAELGLGGWRDVQILAVTPVTAMCETHLTYTLWSPDPDSTDDLVRIAPPASAVELSATLTWLVS